MDGVHAHAIAFEANTRTVYYCHGDGNSEILWSDDEGQNWQTASFVDQPTGAFARDDGIFFGSDTGNGLFITELDPTTGELYSRVHLIPGKYVWHMMDDNGIAYAASYDYQYLKRGMILASRDARHWGILRRFPVGEAGPYYFTGATEQGYQWGLYRTVDGGPPYNWMNFRFRPPTIETIPGLRIEPGIVNLLDTPQSSSAEDSTVGWVPDDGAVLEWVSDRVHSGAGALHITNPGEAAIPLLHCPSITGSFPAGTTFVGSCRLAGRNINYIRARLFDVTNQRNGPYNLFKPRDNWTQTTVQMTLNQPSTEIELMVYTPYHVGQAEFWVDSASISIDGYPVNW